jgi:hypothetical protein
MEWSSFLKLWRISSGSSLDVSALADEQALNLVLLNLLRLINKTNGGVRILLSYS